MKHKIITLACVSLLSTYLLGTGFIDAQVLAQRPTAFTGKPPALVNASVPHSETNWRLPWYYFTLNLPAQTAQSLSKVTIKQGQNIEEIDFILEDTRAFQGDSHNKGEAITIQQVNQDPVSKTIEIVFDSPIPPGTLFTVGLRARKNPMNSGIYLFRILAFPAGDNPVAMDLGVGRLTFYSLW